MLIKTKACTLTTHIPSRLCQCYISVLFLSSSVNLSRCSNLFKCVSMMFVLSFRFLHHGVAHWNCIVFPGGERNCGVHELICVRKGRADQSSGRLTLDPSLQPPSPTPPSSSAFITVKLSSLPLVLVLLLHCFQVVLSLLSLSCACSVGCDHSFLFICKCVNYLFILIFLNVLIFLAL